MKFRKKGKILTVLGVSLAICTIFTGCIGQKQYEVANYQGKLAEGETQSDYNKELFYRNDKQTNFADPFVLDNTERDGYYYMYGTYGNCFCYRSDNLMDWEPVGHALKTWEYEEDGSISEVSNTIWTDIWAPEVIYDAETELYYLFFSATPVKDNEVKAGNGVEEGQALQVLFVATSKFPDRDYQLVNFKDADSCGQENIHTYDESVYPHYYAKYVFLDPAEHAAFCKLDKEYSSYGGYIPGIDPHPYVDENGDKYMFWADWEGMNRICAVKMKNWLTPDWSTATAVLWANYYNEEDYRAAKAGQTVETVPSELTEKGCNEGPEIVKRNGKYYLTFSINYYENNSYKVLQAVSDNILGPYRKLTEEEGGILIDCATAGSQDLSGTGHHSFVTVGEQLYMIYHRHDDVVKGGGPRNHAIDEVKWITIKDKDGNDLDVMYTNGPTCTVQPRLEAFSDYKNIATDAVVTGTEDVSYLTDGLLSIYKYGNANFMEYIKEITVNKSTTFTFDFDSEKTVRAVMIYNSKMEVTSFKNISKVEFVCEENGEEIVRCINNIEVSPECYKANDLDGAIYYVTPGSAAYAEFDELKVKSIRITVDVPKGQEAVGISEIRILGK